MSSEKPDRAYLEVILELYQDAGIRSRMIKKGQEQLRSYAEAQEIHQDTFEILLRKKSDYDTANEALVWKVFQNKVLDRLRTRRARIEVPRQEEDAESTDAPPDVLLALRDVSHRIECLPPKQAAVLRLKALGYSHEEIADRLRMSVPASRQSLARAQRALRDTVGEGEE